MTSTNRNCFNSAQIGCFWSLAKIFSITLSGSVETQHPFLVPDLTKASSPYYYKWCVGVYVVCFLLFCVLCVVKHVSFFFCILRKFLSISSVFIKKGCWLFSNMLSTSAEVPMNFSISSISILYYADWNPYTKQNLPAWNKPHLVMA